MKTLVEKKTEQSLRANKMAGPSTLQNINSINKIDGTNYVELTRPFNDILLISWPFQSKIVSRLEKSEAILRSREGDPIEGSDNDTANSDERGPSNVNDTKAWDSANEHLFSILRLTTRTTQKVFEPKFGKPGDGRKAWLAYQSK